MKGFQKESNYGSISTGMGLDKLEIDEDIFDHTDSIGTDEEPALR